MWLCVGRITGVTENRSRELAPPSLLLAQPQARTFAIKKLNPGFFKDGDDLAEGFRSRPDGAVELFHPLDGAECDFRFPGQLPLRPAKERARGPDLPSTDDDHGATLPRACA